MGFVFWGDNTGLDPGILDSGGYKSHTHNHTHINYNEVI
jgi:hypothetical protein